LVFFVNVNQVNALPLADRMCDELHFDKTQTGTEKAKMA
jgi:hypothetical protein